MLNLLLAFQLRKLFDETLEQPRRQKSVVDSAVISFDGTQIETRPRELIELIEDDPRALTIEAEVLLYGKRNFDGDVGISRSAVRDRYDRHALSMSSSFIAYVDSHNNCAGAILATLYLTFSASSNQRYA